MVCRMGIATSIISFMIIIYDILYFIRWEMSDISFEPSTSLPRDYSAKSNVDCFIPEP